MASWLCKLGIHSDSVLEVWCILSCYQERTCTRCGNVEYWRVDVWPASKLTFIPEPFRRR